MAAQIAEDPVLRQRFSFRRAAAEDGSEVLEVEAWVEPKGGVVPHIHPTFEERFEVLEGEITFHVNGKRILCRAGETALVPAGARHTYANRSRTQAHLIARAKPADPELQGFLEDAAALGRARLSTRHALPRSWRGLLAMAAMAEHYKRSTVITMPPRWLQELLLGPLAAVARRRGFRPGAYATGGLAA
jgi:quercetin dioxygenase-like cupin family protein